MGQSFSDTQTVGLSLRSKPQGGGKWSAFGGVTP